jgi:hypothetical protein
MRDRRGAVSDDARGLVALASILALSACSLIHPKRIQSTLDRAPTEAEMRELWIEPRDLASRDLFHGAGGEARAPQPDARYLFLERDATGFSRGWDVRGPNGENTTWSVKIGLESQTEVVASRLLWAAGYHQPPTYYLRDWTLDGSPEAGPQYPGRFRPEVGGLEPTGTWSFHENPFVGTRPYKGLLVLNLILNNWDLLDRNTALYELNPPRQGVRRWYVVRDLGAALGRRFPFPPRGTRNNLEDFESEGFVEGVVGGRVKFAYRGGHRELFDDIGPADVRWACGWLDRLSARQWKDAFRAAGYADERAERYIRKLRAKVAQGLALPDPGGTP